MGVFDDVAGAKPTGGGSYFEADHEFLVLINEVKHIEVRGGKEGAFIVETKVLKTTCEKVRPGAGRSWYVDLDKDAAAGNLKHFGMAAGEAISGEPVDEEDVDGAGIKALTATDQPLAGSVLRTITYNKPTKAGNPFTRHKWEAPDAKDKAEGLAIAVKLGLIKAPAKSAAK